MWKVEQDSNHVTLINSKFGSTTYQLEGIDLPELSDYSFAVWHALPTAMLSGRDIEIDGRVDPAVVTNAEKLSGVWSMWMPGQLRAVKVHATNLEAPKRGDRPAVVLYSGGVDSTYHLLSRRLPSYVLTVHGMDYKPDDNQHFRALIAKTQPLLDMLDCQRITMRTNVTRYGKAAITHGFTLAGCASLLSDLFASAEIAADYTWEQDLMVWPWGTNHVTNRYFRGSDWAVETVSSDVSRTEKIEEIAKNKLACEAISFCTDRGSRPHNCGRCPKCVRTKLMFLVTGGAVPPIFMENTYSPSMVGKIDMKNRKDRAFFADIYMHAVAKGREQYVPGLGAQLERVL